MNSSDVLAFESSRRRHDRENAPSEGQERRVLRGEHDRVPDREVLDAEVRGDQVVRDAVRDRGGDGEAHDRDDGERLPPGSPAAATVHAATAGSRGSGTSTAAG